MPIDVHEFKAAFKASLAAGGSRSEAVEAIGRHLKIIQGLAHTDERDELQREIDAARAAIANASRLDDPIVRSHIETLEAALPPVERLLARLSESESESTGTSTSSTPPPVPEPEPVAIANPVLAVPSGELASKLADPLFVQEVERWVAEADPTDPGQRTALIDAFRAVPATESGLRTKVFEKAFNTKIKESMTRKRVPVLLRSGKPSIDPKTKQPRTSEETDFNAPLDPATLDKLVEVMAALPAEHVPPTWSFEGQDADPFTRGSYNDITDEAQLVFSLSDARAGFQQDYSGNCAPGDPLAASPAFDLLVRHECGHKAAREVGSDALTSTPDGGDWIHHDTLDNVLTAIDHVLQDFVTKVQVAGEPAAGAIRNAVATADYLDAGVIAESLRIPESRVPADHLLLLVLQQGAYKKYLCGENPHSVDDRIYVVGGPEAGSWFSFDKAAWDRRVSYYQYAAPNEWFAEFYATANNGDSALRTEAKSRYPKAWDWLDEKGCIVSFS